MPCIADKSYGYIKIELNVNVIYEKFISLLKKKYEGDINEGSKFWYYVYCLETEFSNYCNSMNMNMNMNINFWGDWFYNNYNNIDSWEDIKDNFIEE